MKYKKIDTDRLHVAIGATLLEKKVTLFPNSYYKNKAVYDYSLRKFPNISFIENFNTQS
jgi:exopolysaccharide biosynthesis predicted pyruvyltransferase EpsI